jgi:UDP-N-acetylmuramoyl-tripeptide--D-alanyl-D-alanine ligase
MNVLWTSEELERATLGRAAAPFVASGISINSRTVRKGDLYIAIKGERHDGHDFVADAFSRGASGALVSHRPAGVAENAPLLLVANAQRGLEDVGCAARARTDAEIVSVTGSVGKTTVKEMLRLALGALGTVHASAGSLNNHWGVPLTLAEMPRDAKYAVVEIGMNHFGEIRTLNSFVRPHLALITAIAPAHLEFFGSCEAIADAKSEIFASLVQGGPAVLPADSPWCERLIARAKMVGVTDILTFGERGKDAKLVSVSADAEGLTVRAEICDFPVSFRLGAAGRHNAVDALGALLCVAALDGDVANAAAALKAFSALKGRGARLKIGAVTLIDESYNANPASMAAALSVLAGADGRKIAVLGDMLEMGRDADARHAGLAAAVSASHADAVFLCGPHMKALWEKLPEHMRGAYAEDSAKLAPEAAAALRPGDTVLVKGSNGSRMSAVIDAIKARTR